MHHSLRSINFFSKANLSIRQVTSARASLMAAAGAGLLAVIDPLGSGGHLDTLLKKQQAIYSKRLISQRARSRAGKPSSHFQTALGGALGFARQARTFSADSFGCCALLIGGSVQKACQRMRLMFPRGTFGKKKM